MLRRAGREDTEAICALLGAVFPENPKADSVVLAWQYWDNPYGETASWVFTDDDGEIIAHYAAFPIPGVLDGAPTTLAMGADAATAESARGRGLFTKLARATWDDVAERNGLRTVLVAPNPSSKPGALRSGMVEIADLPAFVRPVDPAWLASRLRVPRPLVAAGMRTVFRVKRPKGFVVAEVDAPPHGLDALWSRTATEVRWGMRTDAAWWEWRYTQRPPVRGVPAGYRFVEARVPSGELVAACAAVPCEAFGGRFVFVLDLVADDRQAAAAVLNRLADDPRGAGGVATVALPGSRVAHLVTGAGLGQLPKRLEPRPLHVGVIPFGEGLGDVGRQPWQVSWSLLDHL